MFQFKTFTFACSCINMLLHLDTLSDLSLQCPHCLQEIWTFKFLLSFKVTVITGVQTVFILCSGRNNTTGNNVFISWCWKKGSSRAGLGPGTRQQDRDSLVTVPVAYSGGKEALTKNACRYIWTSSRIYNFFNILILVYHIGFYRIWLLIFIIKIRP